MKYSNHKSLFSQRIKTREKTKLTGFPRDLTLSVLFLFPPLAALPFRDDFKNRCFLV